MANIIKIKTGSKTPTASDLSPSEIGYNKGDNSLYIHDGAQVKKVGSDINMSQIFNAIYPVGSIYMSVNSTNPSSIFGGTWVAWGTGRVPMGINTSDSDFSTVEKIGGNKTSSSLSHSHTVNSHTHNTADHYITWEEVPSHSHVMNHGHNDNLSIASGGSHTHTMTGTVASKSLSGTFRPLAWWTADNYLAGVFSAGSNNTLDRAPTTATGAGKGEWGAETFQFNGTHSHTFSGNIASGGSHIHAINGSVSSFEGFTGSVGKQGGGPHNHGSTTSSAPGTNSQLGNISLLQPYITCYMWKRTT